MGYNRVGVGNGNLQISAGSAKSEQTAAHIVTTDISRICGIRNVYDSEKIRIRYKQMVMSYLKVRDISRRLVNGNKPGCEWIRHLQYGDS